MTRTEVLVIHSREPLLRPLRYLVRLLSTLKLREAEKRRSRVGIKLMNGNVEVDERGVLHMPLYAPCFFEDAGTEDFPPPTSAERINTEYEIRRGASGD